MKKERGISSPLGYIEVNEAIGEGGNAIVYNAQFGQNQVALKVLAEQKNSSKYERFVTEFREIVQLSDTKAVVPIYFFGQIEIGDFTFPYILMKKYPYTLKDWKGSKQFSNFNDLERTLKNLLNILSVIHERNIVHRDLKPENILVDENGEMVLADFGISWFDPEFYERLVHTKKSDRMANYDFSAPEQFEKNSQPHLTMDIFSLGQIITWLITGGVARGNRTPLTNHDKSFVIIEPIISKMLSRSPKERPQSIEDVRVMLGQKINEFKGHEKRQREIKFVTNNLEEFDEVLLFCFPGKRGLIEIEEKEKIEKVLKQLNTIVNKIALWWNQGTANSDIKKFERINDDTWLMDHTEIQIEKLWVLKNNYSIDHQFILIKTKAMPTFEIYEKNDALRWEEAAWFLDRYISREEYDDGFADIDGISVPIEGKAHLRVRNLRAEYYFIASSSNPVQLPFNDSIVTEVYEKLIEVNELEKEDIEKLTKLRRHEISIMLN